MMKKYLKSIVAMSLVFALTSCATIFSGGNPKVTIYGDVEGPLTVQSSCGVYRNVVLPVKVPVMRHHLDGQIITVTDSQGRSSDIIIEKAFNPKTLGNIIIGGLVGFVVDLATNCVSEPAQNHFFLSKGMYSKNDESNSELQKKEQDARTKIDSMFE